MKYKGNGPGGKRDEGTDNVNKNMIYATVNVTYATIRLGAAAVSEQL